MAWFYGGRWGVFYGSGYEGWKIVEEDDLYFKIVQKKYVMIDPRKFIKV